MIYNRQTIALLMRLCKLVSGELGVRLHLDDPEIISKLNRLLSAGASPEVLSVWRAVCDQIGEAQLPASAVAPHRIYRGQVVESVSSSAVAPAAAPPPTERPRSVRIYRGRIVT